MELPPLTPPPHQAEGGGRERQQKIVRPTTNLQQNGEENRPIFVSGLLFGLPLITHAQIYHNHCTSSCRSPPTHPSVHHIKAFALSDFHSVQGAALRCNEQLLNIPPCRAISAPPPLTPIFSSVQWLKVSRLCVKRRSINTFNNTNCQLLKWTRRSDRRMQGRYWRNCWTHRTRPSYWV